MNHDAVLEFDYDDAATASLVADSVAVEVGDIDGERSRAAIETAASTVVVTVEARDLVALRAAINTWTSLVAVAEACSDLTEPTSQ